MPVPSEQVNNPIERIFQEALAIPNLPAVIDPTVRAVTYPEPLGRIVVDDPDRGILHESYLDEIFRLFTGIEEARAADTSIPLREFTAWLIDKELVDAGTARFVNYAWQEVRENEAGLFAHPANGFASGPIGTPPNTRLARNRHEIYRWAERHTGLAISQDVFTHNIVVQMREFRTSDGRRVFRFSHELPDYFQVRLRVVNNFPGGSEVGPGFTYTLFDYDHNVLADSEANPQAPEWRQSLNGGFPPGKWIETADDAFGIARWDPSTWTIRLYWAPETIDTAGCPTV